MNASSKLLGAVLLVACSVGHAQAAEMDAAERQAARAEISRERAANDKQLADNEKICYQHFAVTDCLKKVRAEANHRDRELRQRELAINADERAERTAKQRGAREKKQAEFDAKHRNDGADSGALNKEDLEQRQREHEAQAAGRSKKPARSPQEIEAEQQRRQHDAAQRATQHEQKLGSKQRTQQRRAAEEGDNVEQAREDYDAKQQDAAKRQAEHARRMQEQGKSRKAAPLPVPE
ncbi:hypothetical protein [Comamonas sp. 4034]|uniref:hypothetical protein n=1 Tax=Comamonas sp. 4034 TaxID=3156455 RepID=UPI003D20E290